MLAHKARAPRLGRRERILRRQRQFGGSMPAGSSRAVRLDPLALLDGSVPHLDRKRRGADRDRIGGIGAGAPRGFDQPLGKIDEGGLIEQGGHDGNGSGLKSRAGFGKAQMCLGPARFKAAGPVRPDGACSQCTQKLRRMRP